MEEKVWELIFKLPKKNIVNILFSSLDEMQSYNGRTKAECILLAISAWKMENGWKIPTIDEIKSNTDGVILE